MNDSINELKRLKFEDLLWIIFAVLCLIDVYGDQLQKEYIVTSFNDYEKKSNNVFKMTLTITLLIYIYFFLRNYKSYKNSSHENKSLYSVKVFGSIFLIAGVICLIYFQENNENFIGSPSL